ncbi:MAG: hypothetical protein R2770_00920 [Acidimicrobiales bacterium]|nr:hypothetical protein [Acidimicrobiales bacterium]
MNTIVLRANTTMRALLRRRLALAVLVVMPVAFYFVTRSSVGQSVRALVFGISWAVSTVAFFATVSARNLEPRLTLAGWRRGHLLAGRLLGLLAIVAALTVAYVALVGVDRDVRSLSAVAVDFLVTGAVAVGVGTTVGTVIGREMEGTLVLFFFAGLQAVANPFDTWSRALPFWSSRELGTWAIDGPDIGSLADGLTHAATVVVLSGIVSWAFDRRSAPR